MSLIKLNNNAVKNIDSLANVGTGDLVFISKQTASSDASISFTSGIDSSFKEYIFYWVNIHPQNDDVRFQFNMSTDGGSNYNVTKTTTFFQAYHNEADTDTNLRYETIEDLAQSTSNQTLNDVLGNDNDQSASGYLSLFSPSSTVFVKHFMAESNRSHASDYTNHQFVAGYGNTTSAINAIKFEMTSGNIDSGDILLYGVN